jgi:uncharacterized protein
MDDRAIIDHTRRWIEAVVIGLNLCPFAGRVFNEDKVRYVVTDARDERSLLADLAVELEALASSRAPGVETTLLIHPRALTSFAAYNDFLDQGDRLVEALALEGTIQIASFHPDYQFADAGPDAVENYTNRSPYPMLHLLREASISEVADDRTELLAIPRRNIATLKALGRDKVRTMLKAIEGGPTRSA